MKTLLSALLLSAALSAQAAPTPPDEVVKGTTTELQTLIAKNVATYKKDNEAFYKVVNDVVVPHFDLPAISRIVIGKHWKKASESQRTRFGEAFKSMLIRTYANALLEYHDSIKAEWKPLRMDAAATDVTVNSSLLRGEGKPPISVSFAMQLVNGEWKVYDISVEGLSLVQNFRGQINSEIKRSSLDDTIKRMESGSYVAKPEKS